MRRGHRPSSRLGTGFTLLELMIVLGIFGVLAVMAYGGLASVMKSRAHIAESLERTVALQKAYLALRNDLQQLRARPVRDNFGEPLGALVLQRDGILEFTRSGWRNPLGQPRSALQRVSWRVDDKEHQLLRGYWRVLDRAPDSRPRETAVLDQVDGAEWRFMDKDLQWHAQWPEAAADGSLPTDLPPPRAVELTLHLKDVGPVRLLFSATNDKPVAVPALPQGGNP